MSEQHGRGVHIHNLHVIRQLLEDGNGVAVHGAPAEGLPIHTNGHLGADMLLVKAGQEFPVHTHPGDHLLYCLAGKGTITVAGVTYRVQPGDIYMVEGMVPHAVGAITDHVLVAIGAPHKPVDSPDRMTWVDWDGNPVAEPQQAAGRPADPTLNPVEDYHERRYVKEARDGEATRPLRPGEHIDTGMVYETEPWDGIHRGLRGEPIDTRHD